MLWETCSAIYLLGKKRGKAESEGGKKVFPVMWKYTFFFYKGLGRKEN